MAIVSMMMQHVTKKNSLRLLYECIQCSAFFSYPFQSPYLNPVKDLWDVVQEEIHSMKVQWKKLHELHDTIMSIRDQYISSI